MSTMGDELAEIEEKRILDEMTGTQDRDKQRAYWASQTPEQRLMGLWELNRRLAAWRGVDLDASRTEWTLSVVHRPKLSTSSTR